MRVPTESMLGGEPMERGSDRHGPMVDDELKGETEAIERSGKEPRVEEEREKENPSGHRISGSGSSADEYTYKDHGEEGGRGHPKPDDKRE
jgi:hypothetical protein